MMKHYPADQDAGIHETKETGNGTDPGNVSAEVIRNILAFSRALKVKKTRSLGKIARLMN